MKSKRELELEEVLLDLLNTHFFSKELEWSWNEGYSLLSKDPDLYRKIIKLLPEVLLDK